MNTMEFLDMVYPSEGNPLKSIPCAGCGVRINGVQVKVIEAFCGSCRTPTVTPYYFGSPPMDSAKRVRSASKGRRKRSRASRRHARY